MNRALQGSSTRGIRAALARRLRAVFVMGGLLAVAPFAWADTPAGDAGLQQGAPAQADALFDQPLNDEVLSDVHGLGAGGLAEMGISTDVAVILWDEPGSSNRRGNHSVSSGSGVVQIRSATANQ